jgi:hypothetical protein
MLGKVKGTFGLLGKLVTRKDKRRMPERHISREGEFQNNDKLLAFLCSR